MKKFLRFLLSGFINTLATYITSIILLKILNLFLLVINLLGYIVGIFVSFYLNRNFVFKSNNPEIKKQFYKFIFACLISYFINLTFKWRCCDRHSEGMMPRKYKKNSYFEYAKPGKKCRCCCRHIRRQMQFAQLQNNDLNE